MKKMQNKHRKKEKRLLEIYLQRNWQRQVMQKLLGKYLNVVAMERENNSKGQKEKKRKNNNRQEKKKKVFGSSANTNQIVIESKLK